MFPSYRNRPYRKLADPKKWGGFYSAISKNAPKSENGQEAIGRNKFADGWNKSLEDWGKNEERDLDNTVGDYETKDNHEIREENRRVMLQVEIKWGIAIQVKLRRWEVY